jgi:TetR/AcrR family transcriptional repressor of nem operon
VGHSQAEKALSRERIVVAAARQIRAGGLESVSIAELMKTVKLTHGGFYGHFPSRSALIAAALDRALTEGEARSVTATSGRAAPTLKSILNRYLSPAHRDDPGSGCAVSALAGDVGRADAEVRAIMARRLETYFDDLAAAIGDDPEAADSAVSAWCTMVGAVVLSRVFTNTDRSDAILRLARRSILRLEARSND